MFGCVTFTPNTAPIYYICTHANIQSPLKCNPELVVIAAYVYVLIKRIFLARNPGMCSINT